MSEEIVKRGRGRPKGSKNKPKVEGAVVDEKVAPAPVAEAVKQ